MEDTKNEIGKYLYFQMDYFDYNNKQLFDANKGEYSLHFYTIIYVTEGKGLLTIDNNIYNVCNKSLFILAPGQNYLIQDVENIKGYVIQFSEEYLLHQDDKLIHYLHYDIIHCFDYLKLSSNKDYADIEEYIKLMFNESKVSNENLKIIIERQLLVCLLCKIADLFSNRESIFNHKEHVCTQFIKLIDLHYMEWRHIYNYTEALNITRKVLDEETYAKYKKRPIELINKKICDCAKFLLLHTSLNIKEIAFKLGFEDASNFCKFFKENVGISPGKYRSNSKKQTS